MEWITTETQEQQPVQTAAPPPQAAQPATATALASYDHCSSCGALVAVDQRYCLSCGQRRGDPRLPFMDAVVFMESSRRPAAQAAAPTPPRRRLSPNTALIAGVGTLLLALGIGVLIGRSGGETSTAPQAAPIVIKGGGEEAKTASTGGGTETIGGGGSSSSSKGGKGSHHHTAAPEETNHPAAEEVLKPKGNVKMPAPTVQPGGKCTNGTAGCEGGEFTGNFFGE